MRRREALRRVSRPSRGRRLLRASDIRNVLALWSQPIGDHRRVLRVRQSLDLVESILVANSHALVLPEMFIPRRNDELFDHSVWIGSVLPDAPGGRAGPAATEPSGFQRCNHRFGVSFNCVILHAHQHGTDGRYPPSVRVGPITRRNEILGWNRLEPIAQAGERTKRQRIPAMRNVGERPRCSAVMPSTALPTALPPWKTMR